MNTYYPAPRKPLPPSEFAFLPLGAVTPAGWLRRQLRIQAEGQTGLLPEFWESLGPNSGWLGGTGESWERGPYYLDGLVPLAYLLDDEKLKARVSQWLEWMLGSQDAFGHFGPKSLNDWWPFAVALKVLTQYHEATGDERVITLMKRFFEYMKGELGHNHMHSWAIVRWADMALSIIWLYNRTGDAGLLDLANMVRGQGYDWSWHFWDFAHTEKQTKNFPMRTHVVNNAMGIKAPAVQYLLTGWEEHRQGAERAMWVLDNYHGTAAGIFTGDEHYAGKDPIQGTEVCAVVEYMFSLENLIQILGDPAMGDRLEKIAFNALPGTFSADMKAHQYDQQANQVLCTIDPRPWTNNKIDSNIFGLEPQFGCCTANFHQGWPKFAANLWMATSDDGLAAVAYAPCELAATVRDGRRVGLKVETDYPFDETIRITLRLAQESAFPLKLRAERRYRDSITLTRGPLVYSLMIGERWERVRGEDPCPDYAVYPATPWNYGLLVDPDDPRVEVVKKPVGDIIYGPEFAPVELKVKGRRIPEWGMQNNCAGPVPEIPVISSEPVDELTLVPYGCAKLRITEFPLLVG